MSSPKEENKGRVKVNELPREQEELQDEQAKRVRGGGSKPGTGWDPNSPSTDPAEPLGGRGGISGDV